MAIQGLCGSEVGLAVAMTNSPVIAPSKTIRNKESSKKVMKVSMAKVLPTSAKSRPLNSWMAFRSFYHGLFNGVQQKHASTYLNVLWQKDPFKAKWAVMAKTYTLIKDKVGKSMAPLDTFLQLTCPKMGIIAVNEYLKVLNWNVTYDNGVLSITQIDGLNSNVLDRATIGCSMTHIDLLQYVLDSGYLDEAESFTHDVHNTSIHMLVSAAAKFPDRAEAAFTTAIQNDPKGIAAFIFGIDVNNKFFEISSSLAEVPPSAIENQFIGNIMPVPVAAPMPVFQPVAQMTSEYPWTGNMSELYKPSEMALDFEAMMADNEWMVTDVANPLDMDYFLNTVGGYHHSDLYAGQNGEPTNMIYQFNDSF